MMTVFTKAELVNAIKAGEKNILCKGEIARAIRQEHPTRCNRVVKHEESGSSFGILAGLAGLACIVAAPFTLGSSLGMGAAIGAGALGGGVLATAGTIAAGATTVATATGLTIGSVTLTTRELAIICGTAVLCTAILKGSDIEASYNSDGSVSLSIKQKKE